MLYMHDRVFIHPRVMERHPELRERDVLSAWENAWSYSIRAADDGERIVAIGCDSNGRDIEMIAKCDWEGCLIYHAKTPPTKKMRQELGYGKGGGR